MMPLSLARTCICAFLIAFLHKTVCSPDEKKLKKDLFANYDSSVRPVQNSTGKITLRLGLALLSILDLNEEKGELVISAWLRQIWHDYNLRWNPHDYGGIKSLRHPAFDLWQPDIAVYNNPKPGDTLQAKDKTKLAVIYNDGTILYIPHVMIHAHCSITTRYWPYDTQECGIKFGSWTHDGFQIAFGWYEGRQDVDLTEFIPSTEWNVSKTKGMINTKYYPCCPEPYPDITFQLTLQRFSRYLVVTYVTPCILLAFVMPFIFLLPHTIGSAKIFLGVGLLLAQLGQLFNISNMLPRNHVEVPICVEVYLAGMGLTVVCIILSTITSCLWHYGLSRPLPSLLYTYTIDCCLARLFCVSLPFQPSTGDSDKDMTQQTSNTDDWKQFAILIDRLLFVVMFVLVIVITVGLLGHYKY